MQCLAKKTWYNNKRPFDEYLIIWLVGVFFFQKKILSTTNLKTILVDYFYKKVRKFLFYFISSGQ